MTSAGAFGHRRLFLVIVSAAIFFAAGFGPAFATCDLELQGDGRVVAIIDPRTVRLGDGREVRLAGIEIPAGTGHAAEALLRQIVLDRDVTLHGPDDTPDRYGRQPAYVLAYGNDDSLQQMMLARGAALVGDVPDQNCRTRLLSAEAAARNSGKGVWGDPRFIRNAADPDKILNDIGHFVVVEGRVVSARQAGGTLYLNFGRRWKQGFAVTISRRMMASFAAAGQSAATLENKRIRIRGWVEKRDGPRIEAVRPDQIEVISENLGSENLGSVNLSSDNSGSQDSALAAGGN